MAIQSVNPATGEVVETFTPTSPAEVERALSGAHAAFLEWRGVPIAERAASMRSAARGLRARKDEFARTMTVEMGKPIVQGEAEVEKCAWAASTTPSTPAAMLAERAAGDDALRSLRRVRSAGGRARVMPWNFPFWQVFRFAAPALMAGNAPSSSTPRTCRAARSQIEEVFRHAGFPPALFRTVLVGSARWRAHRRPRIVGGDAHGQRRGGQPGRRAARDAS
jgi:succinate-semialdehyde dehydrogenase/glutarate-semialdehyde dehydrogenase